MAADANGRYSLGPCIGRGSFGDVHKGVDTQTGKEVAFKIIDLEEVEDDIDTIYKEISMLAGCKCNNITEYYTALLKPGSTELMIVMELMACSVADLLLHGPLDEESIAHILHEVLGALVYLHGEKRIHRDIKAANILINAAGHVKVSDFGVSGQLTGTLGFRRRTFVGTPFWMAPEVIESTDDGYSESADIWSLGITAMEMAQGSPPHAELHPMRVLFLIPKSAPPRLEGEYTDAFKDFVAQCLQKEPGARPSARDLLAHPFIASATSPPPALGGMAETLARRRQPLKSRRDMADDWAAAQGTVPGWDFGTQRKFGGRLTIRKGDTIKAAVMDRPTPGGAGRGGVGPGGTVAAAPGKGFAAATGTMKAVSRLSDGGTAAAPGGLVGAFGLTSSTSGSGAAPAADAPLMAGGTGTVKVAPTVASAAVAGGTKLGAGGRYAAQPASSADSDAGAPDKYGTVQSRPAPAVAATPATPPVTDGAVDSDAGGTVLRRAGSLQVHINNPATASPDTAVQLQVQRASGSKTPPPQGAPGESAAVLTSVLLPALDTMGASVTAAAARTAGAAAAGTQLQLLAGLRAQLQHLEKQWPGTSAQLVHELLAHLAGSVQPALQPMRAAAAVLLCPSPVGTLDDPLLCTSSGTVFPPAGGSGSALTGSSPHNSSNYLAALAAAGAQDKPGGAHRGQASSGDFGHHGPSKSSASIAAHGGSGATSNAGSVQGSVGTAGSNGGAPGFLPPRQVAGLSPLGEFLLGRWQVEEARERALLARTGALAPRN